MPCNQLINNYCKKNIEFILNNIPSEYLSTENMYESYKYMELELLCIRDTIINLNYFKKLNILPISLIQVEIIDKSFENKLYYSLLDKLIKIRPYINFYNNIYEKYMTIPLENIPPNSTIEFLSPYPYTLGFKLKIIKVCKKIVKVQYPESDNSVKYRIWEIDHLKEIMRDNKSLYKIY